MSRLGKILFLFAGLSLITFAIGRSVLGSWIPFFWVLVALTGLFAAAAVFWDRKFFVEVFSMKTTKHGMNMGAMVVLVIALLSLVNYLGVKKNKTWDFSAAQRNSLSDQSVQLLKGLVDDLRVSYFYKKGDVQNEATRREFRELIKKYQDQTDKIKLDFYEVNEARSKAEEYGVTKGSGVVFLEYKGKRNRIEKIDEQEITQALIKVTREKNKTIYFTVGHQENDLDDGKDALGLNRFKLMVENNSYNVKTFNPTTQPQVPDDADAVAIIGPKQAFLDYEIKALEEYLKKGGQVFFALEPTKTVGLEKILNTVGVNPQNNFIKSSFMGLGFIDGPTVGEGFSSTHAATKVFSGRREVVQMDWPMDLKLASPAPAGITLEAIVKTSVQAAALPSPQVTEGKFPPGPFNLGVAAKGKYPGSADGKKDFSLIVLGDTDFMDNSMLYLGLNRDLALNSISALAGEDNLISITPREIDKTEINMTSVKQSIFFFGIVLPLPLLMALSSVVLWVRRRSA